MWGATCAAVRLSSWACFCARKHLFQLRTFSKLSTDSPTSPSSHCLSRADIVLKAAPPLRTAQAAEVASLLGFKPRGRVS